MADLPSEAELIRAGTIVWGGPPSTHHKGVEARWGTNGARKIDLRKAVWFDNEEAEGGGWIELFKRAGMWQPKPNGRGNGHARDEFQRIHVYHNEQGQPETRACKRWQGEPGKQWTQQHLNNGKWITGHGRGRWLLYRLPELLRADLHTTVFICEGEKDVDNLYKLGFVATTNPNGAGHWRADYNEHFRGRQVVILPDNDKAGETHTRVVLEELAGIARALHVIRLPGLSRKGDVSDWIEAGGTREELIALVSDVRGEPPAWLQLCILSDAKKDPKPLPVLANALTALRHDPRLTRFITYDEMQCSAMIRQAALRPVSDDDLSDIQERMQRKGLKQMSKETVYDAVESHARDDSFHPLRAEIDSLVWDRRPRLDSWVTAYLGVEANAYSHTVGRLFILSMMARLYKPGCQCDYMLILEGEQGEAKSTACRILAGDAYFSDGMPDLTNDKDSRVHLRGRWLIEIAELHAFSKAESTLLKSFLTRREERYRPPYGRKEVFEPRQCVFIGTSNNERYLRDETGARRFWPLKCGTIRIEGLTRDRDQLLAEARDRFRAGEQYWPDREFEREHIIPEQAARYESDIWTEAIETHLRSTVLNTVTVREVALQALKVEDKMMDGRMEKRIISVLKMAGWRREHTRKGGIWHRPLAT